MKEQILSRLSLQSETFVEDEVTGIKEKNAIKLGDKIMKTKPKIIVGVVAAVAVVAAIVIVTTILLKDNSKKNKSADNGSKGSKNVSASVDLEEAALQKNGKIIPINVQNDYMSYAKQEELAQIECHQDGIYAVTADGKFYFVGYGVYSFEDTKTVFDTGVSSAKYLTGYTSYIDVNGAAYRSGPGVDGSKAVRGFLKVQDDITDMKAFLQFSVYLTKDGRVLVNNVADHQGNLKRSGATEEMNYEEVATNVWEVFLKTGSSDDNYGYLTNDHKLYSMYNGEWVLDLENCMDVSDDGNFVLLDTGVLQYRQLNTSKNTRKF